LDRRVLAGASLKNMVAMIDAAKEFNGTAPEGRRKAKFIRRSRRGIMRMPEKRLRWPVNVL